MTEKWVSTPKWFCRYCKVWIADNKPSRQHHEQGAKHQDLVEKSLRDSRINLRKAAEDDVKVQAPQHLHLISNP
jgi:WW domain-binding protein 4